MAITFSLPRPGEFVRHLWGDMELWLIQPDELETLPDGTALVSIDGSVHVKGKDRIDGDARYGCLAYGFLKAKRG